MTSYIIEKLRAIAERARQGGECLTSEMKANIEQVRRVVDRCEASWSGSQIGYHARVYYKNFAVPPAGHHFSPEWGMTPQLFSEGTVGEWREYPFQSVVDQILHDAGNPNLTELNRESARVQALFTDLKESFDSLLTLTQNTISDTYIDRIRTQSDSLTMPILGEAIRFQYGNIPASSRDSLAVSQGIMPAPHQELLAKIIVSKAPFNLCSDLANLCTKLADHLELLQGSTPDRNLPGSLAIAHANSPAGSTVRSGTKVFIGHGRSQEWRKLKDYLSDTLYLDCDEFNRVPIAGVTNIDRLNAMLDDAVIAIVVMTAEDEVEGGPTRARENVIHEAGLFQGRLGFEKTILLSESGCNIFSNIDGLGRIEFSHENIGETFERVRAVLVREGVIPD